MSDTTLNKRKWEEEFDELDLEWYDPRIDTVVKVKPRHFGGDSDKILKDFISKVVDQAYQRGKRETFDVVIKEIMNFFIEVDSNNKNREFIINGKWYVFKFGCDGMQILFDYLSGGYKLKNKQ